MTVLSSLRGVHLRGLYFTETQRLALSGVGLEEASETGSGRRAQSVEMCACPPDHIGDSCQVGAAPPPSNALEGPFGWCSCLLSSSVGRPGALGPSNKFLLGF